MTDIPPALAVAWQCLQAGDLRRAEQLYREALAARPDDAAAWNQLGAVHLALGNVEAAMPSLRRALALQPGLAAAHDNLGVALARVGRVDEAVACFLQAVRLEPGRARTLANLALVHGKQGRLAEAAANLGQAVSLEPSAADLRVQLAAVLRKLDRADEAEAHLREAVRLDPGRAAAHDHLGSALVQLGRPAEAEPCYREALRLNPTSAAVRNNLGSALTALDRYDEAVVILREAVRLKPDSAEAHNNLGVALFVQGQFDEAGASFREALRWRPDYADARRNQALVWLTQGDYTRGWPEYEWRWKCKEFPPSNYRQPRWDGSPLGGRTILLDAEQGLGDTFQFIRYAPLVKQRGGTVIVLGFPGTSRLLATCPGVGRVVEPGWTQPHFDVHIPLMSLPALFGTTLATVPAAVPYLSADAALVDSWGRELAGKGEFKIGIAWTGSMRSRYNRTRSFSPSCCAALARLPGVRLFSLQKGPAEAELGEVPATALGSRLDESAGAFMDTAAVMMNLDLVIACDSAIPHLAGALGVPAWIPLPYAPDWRWLLEREDSPWYPTVRLFRQERAGDWDEVFERITAAAAERIERKADG